MIQRRPDLDSAARRKSAKPTAGTLCWDTRDGLNERGCG